MDITPVHTLSISGVLSESKRIIRAHYGHFVSLSLLFLPLSYSFIIYPTLRLSFTFDHLHNVSPNHQQAVIYHLLYLLTVYVLAICAITTVTHSSYHVFLGTPVNFSTALKSLAFSFFPILSTAIVAHALLFLISLAFLLFVGVILMLGQTLGLVIDYSSMWFSAVVGATLMVITIYFLVNWSLAFAIVVAESKWGLAPLMRSSYLVKGMRSASLLIMSYFGIFGVLMAWMYTYDVNLVGLRGSMPVLLTMLITFFLMMFMLRSTVAYTVLYMYCKALHGELAIDIAHDYINLPCDYDEKVPHVVTVVAAS